MISLRRLVGLAVPLVLATVVAAAAEPIADPLVDDLAYTQPDQLVSVYPGRRLNLHCLGTGSPTVILEAGLGGGSEAWKLVQPKVAERTKTCSYDRAGLGFSDPSDRPGTTGYAVDDLHRLLGASGVAPPYVLVGHSSGGMIVKLFAETYRSEVDGIVYVDPTHESLGPILWQLEPGMDMKFKQYLESLQACKTSTSEQLESTPEINKLCVFPLSPGSSKALDDVDLKRSYQPSYQRAWVSEMENLYFTSADQVRAAQKDFGSLPVLVLMKEPIPPQPGETQELRNSKNQVWVELLDQIAAQSNCGRRIVVSRSGHQIPTEQPTAVIDATLEVVSAAGSCSKFARNSLQ